MSRRWISVVPWVLALATLALVVTSLAVSPSGDPGATIAGSVIPLTFAVAGAVVASRRPRNGIGWFLCAFSLNIPAENAIVGMASAGLDGALVAWGLWAVSWVWAPMLVGLLTYLPLSFPHGRVVGRASQAILAVATTGVFMIVLGNAFSPDPLDQGLPNPLGLGGHEALLGRLTDIGQLLGLAAGLASVVAVGHRFRLSSGAERQQLKWFVSAIGLVVAGAIANTLLYKLGNPAAGQMAIGAGFVWLPIALGVGILRHGLFDIDRILSRTVAYGLLTIVLAAIYLAAVTTLTTLTAPVAGDSPAAVAAATLLAAAAFRPARRRIQAGVDRRFHRAGYDAARAVDGYRGRLRDELDLEAIADDLLGTVHRTVEPRDAVVWLRTPEVSR